MRNMGEACTAANRIFVQRAVADRFAEKLAARMDALVVGDGLVEGTQVGPLVEEKALAKVERLVADAVERGARVVCGGSRSEGPGYFYPPTVLADVSKDSALMSEEIFGPVAPIVVFDTEDEVVEIANKTPWGLAGYIFTQDVDRSFRVSEALEVGMVGLNTGIVSNPAAPFGGIKHRVSDVRGAPSVSTSSSRSSTSLSLVADASIAVPPILARRTDSRRRCNAREARFGAQGRYGLPV